MENALIAAGLSEAQAQVYIFLVKKGESAPPSVAKGLTLTRTNAYKILDTLVDSGLVKKTEVNKKFVFKAEDPIALSNIVAKERNRVIALEHSVREAMQELRTAYDKSSGDRDVRSYQGNQAVKSLYLSQAKAGQPIYFIKSRADIPTMGYDTMSQIRSLPAKQGTKRHGITPDVPEGVANPAIDRTTNLSRTWMHADDYTASVEWTVSGNELVIIDFKDEASAIRIQNPSIAKAFKELWHLIDTGVRRDPGYKNMPKQAKRKI